MMIHKLADVQSLKIGAQTLVWQYCVILEGATIGNYGNINCNVFIENDVVIGDYVTIKPGVQIWDGMRIGNRVFIGGNVCFTNDLYPRSRQKPERFLPITIEDGVSIGANSTILPNVTLHKYAMIGAATVITKSVPPYTLWVGNPAKLSGYVTTNGKVIDLNLYDKENIQYTLIDGEPVALI